jgi:hypothetical protein
VGGWGWGVGVGGGGCGPVWGGGVGAEREAIRCFETPV